MKRRPHYMRGNKNTELPHNAIWVDTETRQKKIGPSKVRHLLRFGWAAYQRTRAAGDWTEPEWARFVSAAGFWTWAIAKARPKSRLYIFAHNLGFDATVLDVFRILPVLGWTLASAIVESPPTVLVWRKENLTIEMLDTLNIWRTSLAALGESLGIAKLPMPSARASRKVWDTYCKRDVEVIRRALHSWWKFLNHYDLGGFARTLAGQSMRAFRHRFMDTQVLIDCNTRALEVARDSYHGGRTECFRLGRITGPVHCLDVNSMYPFVMRDRVFPTILRLHVGQATLPEIKRWVVSRTVIARVLLETREPRYGIVSEGKLIFPIGSFVASLTTPDLVYALERRHIRRVFEASVYDAFPLFSRFVTEIYGLRMDAARAGNEVHKYLLKILLNSLYGKFAQRGTVWEGIGQADDLSIRVWTDLDYETGTVRNYRQFGGLLQSQSDDPEARDSHPAIASHVTAYARALLWDLMLQAGRENVFYCDTDSLYVNDEGFARLSSRIDPSALGALKHEATYAWLTLNGAKDYETPKGKVIKGIRASAEWLAPNVARQEKWSSLRGMIRSEDLSAPVTETVTKRLSRVYTKGRVSRSGAVLPFVLRQGGG
jgi:hypothetical protein